MNNLYIFFRLKNTDNFFRFYFLPLLLFWLAGLFFLISKGYNNSFLILNGLNHTWLDIPMMAITMLADAGFIACLFIFIFIKKQPYQLIMLLITIIVSGIIAQLFKNFVFSDWHRPPYLFKEQIHTVGKYILNHHSFPSGHSTTISAVFTMLAYFRKEHKGEMLIYAILCPAIAYTRIYLGVHFLGDVIAGIVLGFLCSLILLILIKAFEIRLKKPIVIGFRLISATVAVLLLLSFFTKYL